MTVARPGRPPTQLDIAKQHVERALGAKIAKRLDTFENGIFYVSAGEWARLLSWLMDFFVFVLCASGGFVAVVLATRDSEVSDNVAALTMVGLLVAVPVLYGLFFGNGRALGAVLTGTRLVRVKNGHRIGAAACWAMLVRTVLFPPLLIAMMFEGAMSVGSVRRISIDDDATQQLHAAGFLRVDVPSQAPR